MTLHLTRPVADRRRAGEAAFRQMVHQAEKERQFLFHHTLFIKGENVERLIRMEKKVGVLDAFSSSLEGKQITQIICGEKSAQLLVADIGVDRHTAPVSLPARAEA